MCPAHTLLNYLKLRLKLEGPLFCHFNHKSVTRFQVSSMLKSTLRFLNLNEQDFNTHSFRIGAATSFITHSFRIGGHLKMILNKWDGGNLTHT